MIDIDADPLADLIRQEQAAEHRQELRQLSDLAFIFLSAADGDIQRAERMLDEMISLLFEGGYLSTWRYRVVLGLVREGL